MIVSNILAKSSVWHADRRQGIGGSDATKIMTGDWLALWEEKTGRREPEDLSRVLAVQMGTFTEPLNRFWFQQETGIEVWEPGPPLVHPVHDFMRCNLDGGCDGAIWEAKHTSAFTKDDEVVSRYFWQLQHNMAVADSPRAYLSVFFGNAKWAYFEVPRDDAAIADLIAREAEFWRHVIEETPPQEREAIKPVIAFDEMRDVDMAGSNAWASYAADWLQHRDAAKAFKKAETELKALVDADVKRAHGAGIEIKRSKAGALSIKEVK